MSSPKWEEARPSCVIRKVLTTVALIPTRMERQFPKARLCCRDDFTEPFGPWNFASNTSPMPPGAVKKFVGQW